MTQFQTIDAYGIDASGLPRNIIDTRKVVHGCYIEAAPGNLYRITKRIRDPKDRRHWIPDVSCQDVLTGDEYQHLWLPNVVCDEHFRTKPDLERISARVARLEREVEEATDMRIFHDPDAFAPYWGWKDETIFEFVFNGGTDADGDEFLYSFECLVSQSDGLTFIFDKMYEDDHIDAAQDLTAQQIRLFMQLITTLMAYDKGLTCLAAKEAGWLL